MYKIYQKPFQFVKKKIIHRIFISILDFKTHITISEDNLKTPTSASISFVSFSVPFFRASISNKADPKSMFNNEQASRIL